MQAVMARIRITIDCEEAFKRAFLAWANLEGQSPQELFEAVVQAHCPDDILNRAKRSVGGDDEDPGLVVPRKPRRKSSDN